MPDNKRVDLTQDLDSLLRDVKAATEEVKLRKQQDKQKEVKAAQKEKSRKQSSVIIAVSVIVLVVVAYFVVFAGTDKDAAQTAPVAVQPPTPSVQMNTQQGATSSVPTTRPVQPSQPVNVPPDDYEQPRGM